MIISASRRTDIPAFHTGWFIRRLEDQYVLVPNPYNSADIRKIKLHPDVTDCIVFWTKNAGPMLERIDEIDRRGFQYCFQYTVTAFDQRVERGLPDRERRLDTFIRTSEKVGKKSIDWRFDPIMIDSRFSISWYEEQFEQLCEQLHPYTERCIISFADSYAHLRPVLRAMEYDEIREAAAAIGRVAARYQLPVYTCAEAADLKEFGIRQGACIDKERLEAIIGCRLDLKKDKNQRAACGCVESVDIGAYNTCGYDCSYCYACISRPENRIFHKYAPMLTGYPTMNETVREVAAGSDKINQQSLFDKL